MGIYIILLIAAAALIIAGTAIWYAFVFEPANFKLSEITVNIKSGKSNKKSQSGEIPEEIKSFKSANVILNPSGKLPYRNCRGTTILQILHLTDFHLRKDRNGRKLFSFIKSLWSLKPDLIFLTGDLVEKDAYFDYLIEMLTGLDAKLGKYAVFGVHDYYHKRPTEFIKNMIKRQKKYMRQNSIELLVEKLEKIGITSLRNEKVILNLNPQKNSEGTGLNKINKIEIVGVDDAVIERADTGYAFGGHKGKSKPFASGSGRASYRQVLKRPSGHIHSLSESGKLKICITHTPDMDLFVDFVENKTDIVISGHTHGGQVRIPAVGALISGANIPVKYASGLFYFEKFVLYISRGLGEGRYSPFRVYCQPEATLININSVF